MPSFSSINDFCRAAEKVFNVAECMPVVVYVSSPLRSLAGHVQLLAGGVTSIVGMSGHIYSVATKQDAATTKKWERLAMFGLEHVIHGSLNILRSLGALFIANHTFMSLGNVVLIIPNMAQEEKFGPVMEYGTLAPTLRDQVKQLIKA